MKRAAVFIAVHFGTHCSIDLGQPGNHTGVESISPAQDVVCKRQVAVTNSESVLGDFGALRPDSQNFEGGGS